MEAKSMKVFFACSMRGGYGAVKQEFLKQIPGTLEEMGLELMSKHQTKQNIIAEENQTSSISIHDRDYSWLEGCDIVIAELSNPSLGVGGEVADAIHLKIPVLGLYQLPEEKISAYIRGKIERSQNGRHAQYKDLQDFKRITREFINFIQAK